MTQLSFLAEQPKETVAWVGTREAAQTRLNMFLPRAGRAYASSRNHDFGPADRSNISCLSPWIRHRVLLEEEVVRATLSRHSLANADKFVQEVFWRSYFKGWLEQRPSVWAHYQNDLIGLVDQVDARSELRADYECATSGTTGIACFDVWVQELLATGYLHNHARMWFASIWIFTLRLPWQLGADFFYQHLLDGDPASNTLSWRWVAGLHTRGKTYLARQSNIETFTQGRFSPEGLAREALPLFENFEHPIHPLREDDTLGNDEPFGLLITQEDCLPETLECGGKPKGIGCLSTTDMISPFSSSALKETFSDHALEDASRRAGDHFECNVDRLDWNHEPGLLVSWAKGLDVKTLATARLPVGPVREKLNHVRHELAQADIRLIEITRPYDHASWQHATKGFFKMKAKIPHLVEMLGLGRA